WRRTAGGGKRSGGRWNKNLKSCIADIIRWVADEKEARGYLQALATKMTEELEYLKIVLVYGHSRSAFFDHPGVCSSQMRDTAAAVCEGLSRPGPALHSREDTAQVGGAESDPGRAAAQPAARELGSSRCEMSRTLPSCCTAEIQAKQQVGEELSRTRAELLHSQRELLETRQRLDALAHDMKRKEQHIREMQTRLDAPHQPSNSFLDRPASQLSYLDQFLSEAPTERHYDNVPLVNNEEKMSPQYRYGRVQHCCNAQKLHQFLVRTFSSPTKCNHCTSLMIGLTRQGVVCETCGLAVHTSCCARVASRCPLPASRSRRPLGIDPARGQGTAYEGYVKVSHEDRQGVVCETCGLAVHTSCCARVASRCPLPASRSRRPLGIDPRADRARPTRDMLSHEDRQGGVCETCGLAVHTSCCARVASRCPLPASRSRRPLGIDPARGQGTAYEGYVKRSHTLMLAESESEKTKWVVALSELHRILKRNNLPDKCITRTAARRCRIAELRAPGAVHSVQLARGRLLLGYRGGFAAHALPDPRRPTTTSPPSVSTQGHSTRTQRQLARGRLLLGYRGGSRHTRCPTRAAPTTTSPPSVSTRGHSTRTQRQLARGRLLLGYRGGFAAHALPDPRRPDHDQPALCEYTRTQYTHTAAAGARPPAAGRQLARGRLLLGYRGGFAAHALPDPRRPDHDQPALCEYTRTQYTHTAAAGARPPAAGRQLARGRLLLGYRGGFAAHALPDPRRPDHDQPALCEYTRTQYTHTAAAGARPPAAGVPRGFAAHALPDPRRPDHDQPALCEYTRTQYTHTAAAGARPPAAGRQLARGRLLLGYRGGFAAHALPDPRRPDHDQPALCEYTRTQYTHTAAAGARPPAAGRQLARGRLLLGYRGGFAAHALPDPRRPEHDQPALCEYTRTQYTHTAAAGARPPAAGVPRGFAAHALPDPRRPEHDQPALCEYTRTQYTHTAAAGARPPAAGYRGGFAAHALPDPRRPEHDQPALCEYTRTQYTHTAAAGARPPAAGRQLARGRLLLGYRGGSRHTRCPTRAAPNTTSPPSVSTRGHSTRTQRQLARGRLLLGYRGGFAAHALPDPRRPEHDQPALCEYTRTQYTHTAAAGARPPAAGRQLARGRLLLGYRGGFAAHALPDPRRPEHDQPALCEYTRTQYTHTAAAGARPPAAGRQLARGRLLLGYRGGFAAHALPDPRRPEHDQPALCEYTRTQYTHTAAAGARPPAAGRQLARGRLLLGYRGGFAAHALPDPRRPEHDQPALCEYTRTQYTHTAAAGARPPAAGRQLARGRLLLGYRGGFAAHALPDPRRPEHDQPALCEYTRTQYTHTAAAGARPPAAGRQLARGRLLLGYRGGFAAHALPDPRRPDHDQPALCEYTRTQYTHTAAAGARPPAAGRQLARGRLLLGYRGGFAAHALPDPRRPDHDQPALCEYTRTQYTHTAAAGARPPAAGRQLARGRLLLGYRGGFAAHALPDPRRPDHDQPALCEYTRTQYTHTAAAGARPPAAGRQLARGRLLLGYRGGFAAHALPDPRRPEHDQPALCEYTRTQYTHTAAAGARPPAAGVPRGFAAHALPDPRRPEHDQPALCEYTRTQYTHTAAAGARPPAAGRQLARGRLLLGYRGGFAAHALPDPRRPEHDQPALCEYTRTQYTHTAAAGARPPAAGRQLARGRLLLGYRGGFAAHALPDPRRPDHDQPALCEYTRTQYTHTAAAGARPPAAGRQLARGRLLLGYRGGFAAHALPDPRRPDHDQPALCEYTRTQYTHTAAAGARPPAAGRQLARGRLLLGYRGGFAAHALPDPRRPEHDQPALCEYTRTQYTHTAAAGARPPAAGRQLARGRLLLGYRGGFAAHALPDPRRPEHDQPALCEYTRTQYTHTAAAGARPPAAGRQLARGRLLLGYRGGFAAHALPDPRRPDHDQPALCEYTRTQYTHTAAAGARPPAAGRQLARGRLLLGYRGGFAAHALPDPRRPDHDQPALSLVHPENQVNLFLSHSGARPLCAAAVPNSADTLLVFNSLALYTSTTSRVGTNARPLDASGWLCCVCGGATNGFPFGSDTTPFIIYLRPLLAKGPLNVEHAALWGSTKRRSERRSRLISAPTNFAHLSHMGPGDGIRSQRLLDLPTTVETADDLPQVTHTHTWAPGTASARSGCSTCPPPSRQPTTCRRNQLEAYWTLDLSRFYACFC
ncbi:LOW QUALITY PROTEIN: hypothetical protein MSG28_015760, partial [Choristoneura fumiferana]